MTTNTAIQFNAHVPDLEALALALKSMSPDLVGVEVSRWVKVDELTGEETDAGPRLDVEILHRARPQARPTIEVITVFLAESPLVILT
jgi:hypothetical protein